MGAGEFREYNEDDLEHLREETSEGGGAFVPALPTEDIEEPDTVGAFACALPLEDIAPADESANQRVWTTALPLEEMSVEGLQPFDQNPSRGVEQRRGLLREHLGETAINVKPTVTPLHPPEME